MARDMCFLVVGNGRLQYAFHMCHEHISNVNHNVSDMVKIGFGVVKMDPTHHFPNSSGNINRADLQSPFLLDGYPFRHIFKLGTHLEDIEEPRSGVRWPVASAQPSLGHTMI